MALSVTPAVNRIITSSTKELASMMSSLRDSTPKNGCVRSSAARASRTRVSCGESLTRAPGRRVNLRSPVAVVVVGMVVMMEPLIPCYYPLRVSRGAHGGNPIRAAPVLPHKLPKPPGDLLGALGDLPAPRIILAQHVRR